MPGWRTNRKLVVIESDDWGSIRMPSKEVYEKCLKAGYPVDKIAFERYDSLLSQVDLELLFNLLTSFRDKNGKHPIITANCVVANPDFVKIKADNFNKYHYELITDTFKRYPCHYNNFNLWQQGIAAKIFHPQFHGREHLNVNLFLNALRKKDKDVLFGFENEMPGCISLGPEIKGNSYVDATFYDSFEGKNEILSILDEGLELFRKIFGYWSGSIIPTNYTWSPDFDQMIRDKRVIFFQGIRKIREPIPGGEFKYHTIYLGKKNKLGQLYLVRNVHFEPSLFRLKIKDPVDQCLSDMQIAFKMHKPVVISSHRINYVGFIDETNRDKTLKMLHQVLTTASKYWPDIEFITSDQLGRIILANNNNSTFHVYKNPSK